MTRTAHKVDALQAEVVMALRKVGASVFDLSAVGHGVPDLLVGYHYQNWLLEVKAPKGKSTPMQLKWMNKWNGRPVTIVRSVEEALIAIGAMP